MQIFHPSTNTISRLTIYGAVIFAGFGLLTMGRVMAQTVPMRAELDATV